MEGITPNRLAQLGTSRATPIGPRFGGLRRVASTAVRGAAGAAVRGGSTFATVVCVAVVAARLRAVTTLGAGLVACIEVAAQAEIWLTAAAGGFAARRRHRNRTVVVAIW